MTLPMYSPLGSSLNRAHGLPQIQRAQEKSSQLEEAQSLNRHFSVLELTSPQWARNIRGCLAAGVRLHYAR